MNQRSQPENHPKGYSKDSPKPLTEKSVNAVTPENTVQSEGRWVNYTPRITANPRKHRT